MNWKTCVLCASSIERLLFINFNIANFIEFVDCEQSIIFLCKVTTPKT